MSKFKVLDVPMLRCFGLGIVLLAAGFPAAAQTGAATWWGGSSHAGAPGAYPAGYGQVGHPGARNDVQTARDAQGNLWLYGGIGHGSSAGLMRLADLWMFDVASATWLWVAGSPDSTEASYPAAYGGEGYPGGRTEGALWVDADGNLWLFGGRGNGTDYGLLNDLWKYTVATGQWTWEAGDKAPGYFEALPSNPGESGTPSARYNFVSWPNRDGDLAMWGGIAITSGGGASVNSEMWKYDTSEGEWIYVGAGQVASSEFPALAGGSGFPRARSGAAITVDAQKNLWMVGGSGFGSGGGDLTDVWKFDYLADEWHWMGGEQGGNQPAVYPAAGYGGFGRPGARSMATIWVDDAGAVWLFGGVGYGTDAETYGFWNDLWRFHLASNRWQWVAGSSEPDAVGDYPAATGEPGYPGARRQGVAVMANEAGLWMFGGNGYAAISGGVGQLNDQWILSTTVVTPPSSAQDWQLWQ